MIFFMIGWICGGADRNEEWILSQDIPGFQLIVGRVSIHEKRKGVLANAK
jgi:hypothetical protein